MAHRLIYPSQPKNMDDLLQDLHKYELHPESAEKLIFQAVRHCEKILKKAGARTAIIVQGQRTEWIDHFNKDKLLCKWFGEVNRPQHVLSVHNALEAAANRLISGLEFRFRPGIRATSKTKANGTNFSAKALNIYPRLFKQSMDPKQIAAIFIGELMQLWYARQYLKGSTHTARMEAEKLARKNPEMARKNAENYERFCLELWNRS